MTNPGNANIGDNLDHVHPRAFLQMLRRPVRHLDAMVKNAGGEVIYRRWDGGDTIEGQTIYFVFARPNP